jgi:ABC-2 type transport system permease protein
MPSTKPAAAKPPTGGTPFRSLRPHVLGAIFRRNFFAYFSTPTGYVFLVLFVLVCSIAQFVLPDFFANNLANLDQLNRWMPLLLLFFIPAITMSAWAEERKQGTDELLLTLPAADLEAVLGKFLACLGIYTTALFFLALGHVPLLAYVGNPDWGIILATYIGYFLMGAMLISIGLVASMLAPNVTVAFILGAVFCAIPVLTWLIGSVVPGPRQQMLDALSVPSQFRDFGTGVIALPSVLYFLALTAAMLYLNMVLLGRRHWAGGSASTLRWLHATVRTLCVGLSLLAICLLAGHLFSSSRADVTQEKLHTLSPISREIIQKIPANRPVFIQAYYSPDVPREFVQTRADLLNTLREVKALGGDRVQLSLVETEPFSTQARDAEKRYGITARTVRTSENASQGIKDIYLGVAFASGLEEVVVPFFDRGLPVEYEVVRSLRVVSGAKRKKVGILNTDARLMGGVDFRTFAQENEWLIVTELRKQYEITQVSPDGDIPSDIDVLLVAQPSSLTQKQIDALTAHVQRGGATLLFVDPFPAVAPWIAPDEPRQPPGGMFGGPPPEPKGDLTPLWTLLGIDWPTSSIVWNPYNPHLQLDLPPEYVFIGEGSRARNPFGSDPISKGLQEVVLLYAGLLRERGDTQTKLIPLLRTNDNGGVLRYSDLLQRNPFGRIALNPNPSYDPSGIAYTLAARVEGSLAPRPAPPAAGPDAKPADSTPPAAPAQARVVVIADLDMISDNFFLLRRREEERLDIFQFDNVSFVLNCVDALAGDDSFIELRKRRPGHRTLSLIEAESETAIKDAQRQARAAEQEAVKQREEAQRRLDQEVEKIRQNKELDDRTKETMAEYRREVETRKLEATIAEINDKERQAKLESKANERQRIQSIHNRVRAFAVLFPWIPVVLLGGLVWGVRSGGENKGASPSRIV